MPVIDIRTRLPRGHIVNTTQDMSHHARRLARASEDVRRAAGELRELARDVAGKLRDLA